MGKNKVLEKKLDKIDLTLDCIFAGDLDKDLLPQNIRSYHNRSSFNKDYVKRFKENLFGYKYNLNFKEHLYDSYLSRYRQIFNTHHPKENIDPWMKYRKGENCDDCGKKLNILNKAFFALCDRCNQRLKIRRII